MSSQDEDSNLSNASGSRRRGQRDHVYQAANTLDFESTEDSNVVIGPTTRRQWSEWVSKPKSPGLAVGTCSQGSQNENKEVGQRTKYEMKLLTGQAPTGQPSSQWQPGHAIGIGTQP